MKSIGRVALCGAIAGTINAWLCYAGLPVPVDAKADFKWHVIPAGAVHGAVLAALAFGTARQIMNARLSFRLGAAVPVAWFAGYLSWIPLNRSAFDESWSTSLLWPLRKGVGELWIPFPYFGLVALIYYLLLVTRGLDNGGVVRRVGVTSVAGVLGSLWWWMIWEHWYFSVIHGVIWGVFVGLGTPPASSATQMSRASQLKRGVGRT